MATTTAKAMTTTNVDNEAPWAKVWNFLIALRNGNHDSKNQRWQTTTVRAMQTISHCAQAHDLLILAMTVRKVDNEALVRKRTIREPSAGHELSITHRAQAHQLLITGLTTIICPWRYPQSERPRHLHHITRWRQQQQRRWQQQMSTTRPHGQKYGIFLLRCVKATTTAKISDDKRQLSDDEALCLSTQHIHITSRDVNNDNGNQTSRR